MFQVAARETPHGKRAAYSQGSFSMGVQVRGYVAERDYHTGVPFLKKAPRAPLGPSEVLIEGIPFEGMATVLQKSAPASREIYHGPVIVSPLAAAEASAQGYA